MISCCDKIRDKIADLVTGILPEPQLHAVEQHLSECSACRDYARSLKKEDMLLTELFAKIDTNMTSQQERVLKAIEHSGASKQTDILSIGRIIMKSRITKLAAAAVIIIVTLVTVHYFCGPVDIAALALANIVKEISNARTVIYKETFYPGESREYTTTEMINESGIRRTERPNGYIVISDFSTGKQLELFQKRKKAILTQRVGRPRRKKLYNHIGWLSMILEVIKFAEEREDYIVDEQGNYTVDEGVWYVGKKEVDGKMADVFVLKRPFEQITVWIDTDTNLPVRVKEVNRANPNKDIITPYMALSIKDFGGEENESRGIGMGSSGGIQKEMTSVMSDFVWNTELDESLFSLEPPEGYTIEERQFDVSEMGENGLVQALKFWTEMSGGMFPSKINDLGDPNIIRPMLIAKFDRDGDPAKELDQAMKQLHIVLKGLLFAQKMKVDGIWYYAGDGVKLGDADAPVCRWRSKGLKKYRVIYGDLRLSN